MPIGITYSLQTIGSSGSSSQASAKGPPINSPIEQQISLSISSMYDSPRVLRETSTKSALQTSISIFGSEQTPFSNVRSPADSGSIVHTGAA